MYKNLLFVAAIATLSACGNNTSNTAASAKPDPLASHLDTTVNPADDFFDYANGGWIKAHPIPADETGWGIGEEVDKELREKLLALNEQALKANDATGAGKMIGDFWYSGMDTTAIEKAGLAPLKPELDRIAALNTPADAMSQVMHMHHYGVNVLFSGDVGQDAKNSDQMAFHLSQGGLGLPNRDYYFNTTSRTAKILQQYPHYIATLFQLMGDDTATAMKKAVAVVALETRLAAASRKLEALRDPYANYHKMAVTGLNKMAPGADWPQYLQLLGVQHVDSVIVGQPEFFTALGKVVTTSDIATLRDYLTFHLLSEFGDYLSKPFVDANFDFYHRTLRGVEQQQERTRRVLDAEQGVIGEALGQLFVKEYFSPAAKARYEQIVENVRNAYKVRMEHLDWMSDTTRERAIHKLMAITKKVGYPDKWKDFSTMKIDRGPYVLNMMHAAEWWNQYQLDKLGKPVDRTEWDMTPQTYNAYYNESNNEIVLPAAMMTVPGYRDEELDDALVYGYMAASTVGHEITHGFDDQGRKFDEKGNLRSWWDEKDTLEFGRRADVLVQQFNAFTPVDTIHINGRATLGENLADLGGILIGLDAFKQTETYKKGEKIAGLTPLQRFFLGYALGWMMTRRTEVVADRLLTDVHSPAKYRVNGPFPNVPEFYEAFSIKPGDKMYIPDSLRVHLW